MFFLPLSRLLAVDRKSPWSGQTDANDANRTWCGHAKMKLMNYLELLTRPLLPPLKMWVIFGIADPAVNDGHIGITGMPNSTPSSLKS